MIWNCSFFGLWLSILENWHSSLAFVVENRNVKSTCTGPALTKQRSMKTKRRLDWQENIRTALPRI